MLCTKYTYLPANLTSFYRCIFIHIPCMCACVQFLIFRQIDNNLVPSIECILSTKYLIHMVFISVFVSMHKMHPIFQQSSFCMHFCLLQNDSIYMQEHSCIASPIRDKKYFLNYFLSNFLSLFLISAIFSFMNFCVSKHLHTVIILLV